MDQGSVSNEPDDLGIILGISDQTEFFTASNSDIITLKTMGRAHKEPSLSYSLSFNCIYL